jgi:serine/threonine protein kinase
MENFQESGFSTGRNLVLLKDRYEIREKLGEGGFAETFLAHDRETGSACVLKILSWKDIPDWKVIELFEREARVLSQMKHAQIPHFIEFFTEEIESGTKIVLVQEYISGKNLAESIRAGKHYREKEVIEIGLQVTDILEYLHGFSPPIIHRDIKPSNLLESDDGELHLIDFGAVRDKVLHHQKTEAGGFTVVGTYGFMPFEQFQGQAVPASDIYSLGMSMITLLSHKEPHEMELTGSFLDFEPYLNVSANFRDVLKKMIAHRVEDRYASAAELRKDLEALLRGEAPQSLQPKRNAIRSGTVVMLIILLFIGLFLLARKPADKPASVPVTTPKSSTTVPYAGKVVRGKIQFDGRPITEITNGQPYFWFRDESVGKTVTAETTYSNGEFEFRGLPPGQYGVSVQFDANPRNPRSYPGDLRSWNAFKVTDQSDTLLQVELSEIIYMIKPEDNGVVLSNWNRCCEEQKPQHRGELEFEWRSLGKNVRYDYSVTRVICPYQGVGSVASGTTDQTKIKLNLPPNRPNEYYILQLHARKNGRQIGMLMTHGSNGYGWDYRFVIP